MAEEVKGLDPHGPPSWSAVNLLLPLQVTDGGEPTPMFALAHWLLPRVPVAGEEIEAIGARMTGWRADVLRRAVRRGALGHSEEPSRYEPRR
jgi:hypothetical protein